MRSCRETELAGRRCNATHQSRAELDKQHGHGQPHHETRTATALKTPRRPSPDHVPHQEAEVERAGVDDEPLHDVLMAAQVGAAKPAGVIDVRKGALDVLSTSAHQPLPASAAY